MISLDLLAVPLVWASIAVIMWLANGVEYRFTRALVFTPALIPTIGAPDPPPPPPSPDLVRRSRGPSRRAAVVRPR